MGVSCKNKRKKQKKKVKLPVHWKISSEKERKEDYKHTKSKYLHLSYIQFDIQFDVSLNDLVAEIHLLKLHRAEKILTSYLFFNSEESPCLDIIIRSEKQQGFGLVDSDILDLQDITQAHVPVHTNTGSASMQIYNTMSSSTKCPILINTGAFMSVTPFIDNFITPLTEPDVNDLQGMSGATRVDGKGIVQWKVRDYYGCVAIL